jgi:RING-box protein 1
MSNTDVPELVDVEQSTEQSLEGKIILEQWIQPASYAPKAANEKCSICYNHLNEKCATCLSENNDILNHICTISLGGCGHAFHTHCINKWTNDVKTCPIDKSPWITQVTDCSISDWTHLVVQKKQNS